MSFDKNSCTLIVFMIYFSSPASGSIDQKEFSAILSSAIDDNALAIGPQQIEYLTRTLFDTVDANGDGVISFDELKQMLEKSPTWISTLQISWVPLFSKLYSETWIYYSIMLYFSRCWQRAFVILVLRVSSNRPKLKAHKPRERRKRGKFVHHIFWHRRTSNSIQWSLAGLRPTSYHFSCSFCGVLCGRRISTVRNENQKPRRSAVLKIFSIQYNQWNTSTVPQKCFLSRQRLCWVFSYVLFLIIIFASTDEISVPQCVGIFIVAKGFGKNLNYQCMLLVIFMCRRTLTLISGTRIGPLLPIDMAVFAHKVIGYVVGLCGLGHWIFHMIHFR